MFDYYGYFDVCLVCGKDYPDWETEEDDICEGCLKEKNSRKDN